MDLKVFSEYNFLMMFDFENNFHLLRYGEEFEEFEFIGSYCLTNARNFCEKLYLEVNACNKTKIVITGDSRGYIYKFQLETYLEENFGPAKEDFELKFDSSIYLKQKKYFNFKILDKKMPKNLQKTTPVNYKCNEKELEKRF